MSPPSPTSPPLCRRTRLRPIKLPTRRPTGRPNKQQRHRRFLLRLRHPAPPPPPRLTPDDVGSLFDSYQMNGSAGFASAGATSAQVLKAGFSMLLIGFGATDICAFGAKYMKAKKREQK